MTGWNMPDGCTGGEDYFMVPDPPECPDCYAQLDGDWLYCPLCGRRVGEGAYDSMRDYEADTALGRMTA